MTATSDAERFWSHTVLTATGCIFWTGHLRNKKGYGGACYGGRVQMAHRVAYELTFGSIPDGMSIDHLCRTPRCVNPAHLDVVTPAENIRRAAAFRTHCRRGHLFDRPHWLRGNYGCRSCSRERKRISENRRRDAINARRRELRAIRNAIHGGR